MFVGEHHAVRELPYVTGRLRGDRSLLFEPPAGFGASALLLAFHRGDPLEPTVLAAGAEPLPLGPWMPGQHYFVR